MWLTAANAQWARRPSLTGTRYSSASIKEFGSDGTVKYQVAAVPAILSRPTPPHHHHHHMLFAFINRNQTCDGRVLTCSHTGSFHSALGPGNSLSNSCGRHRPQGRNNRGINTASDFRGSRFYQVPVVGLRWSWRPGNITIISLCSRPLSLSPSPNLSLSPPQPGGVCLGGTSACISPQSVSLPLWQINS